MAHSFTHKYVDSVDVVMRHEGGGFVSDTLVITANIPLLEGSLGFDQNKMNELVSAAMAYAADRGHPYKSVFFKGRA